jgi:hypothetical protein
MSDNSSSSDSNVDSSSSDREAARLAQELLHDQAQLLISMQVQIARLKAAAATAVQLCQARVARKGRQDLLHVLRSLAVALTVGEARRLRPLAVAGQLAVERGPLYQAADLRCRPCKVR